MDYDEIDDLDDDLPDEEDDKIIEVLAWMVPCKHTVRYGKGSSRFIRIRQRKIM